MKRQIPVSRRQNLDKGKNKTTKKGLKPFDLHTTVHIDLIEFFDKSRKKEWVRWKKWMLSFKTKRNANWCAYIVNRAKVATSNPFASNYKGSSGTRWKKKKKKKERRKKKKKELNEVISLHIPFTYNSLFTLHFRFSNSQYVIYSCYLVFYTRLFTSFHAFSFVARAPPLGLFCNTVCHDLK